MLINFTLLSQNKDYSFFVAGHTYGSATSIEIPKIYPLFKEKFKKLNEQQNIEFGFLLGDVVKSPKNWPTVLKELKELQMPYYVARGNHDGPLDDFEKMFGKSYKKFTHNNNLFVILDPNLDHWNISGEQLEFLKNTLSTDGEKAKNIFVFMHQVIWWTNDKFSKPKPNWVKNKAENSNYWHTIEPLLKATKKPIYLFAGDVGAYSKEYKKRDHIIEYSYFKEDSITYITTGMGGGIRDNLVIVDVYDDNSVKLNLIHLNGNDIHSLGKLEDYTTNPSH